MSLLVVFAKGFTLGLAIAAPVGPIGLLCIQRTLTEGRLAGLASGLGAATADAVYGAIASFGLVAVASLLVGQQQILRLAGGLFLLALGLRILRQRPSLRAARARGGSLAIDYLATFGLTLANPLTILSFVAAFAAIGFGRAESGTGAAATLVLGVFLGSAAWWLFLALGVGAARHRLSERAVAWLNRMVGAVMIAFGVGALVAATLP